MNPLILHSRIANSAEPVAANMAMASAGAKEMEMAVSTLFLQDVIHRRNQQQARGKNFGQAMPDIKESPDEADDYGVASAALNAAVVNLQVLSAY